MPYVLKEMLYLYKYYHMLENKSIAILYFILFYFRGTIGKQIKLNETEEHING